MIIVFLSFLMVSPLPSQSLGEWPGILGQFGDLRADQSIEFQIPTSGLEAIWQKAVGSGYSGPVASRGKVILYHRIGEREMVEAFSLQNGDKQWSAQWESRYADAYGKGDGPRSTPLVVDGLVLVYSPDGVLRALDLETGGAKWRSDLANSLKSKQPFFGFGASPALVDGVLVLNAGGEGAGIVGILPKTGETLWRQTNHPAGYATAVDMGDGGAAVFTRTGIVLLRAKTGDLIYEKRWRSRMDASVNASSPVRWSQGLLFSSSYGTGCVAIKPKDGRWEEAWSGDKSLSCHFATPIHVNGLVLGFHGRQEEGTELRCIDPASGKVYWTREGVGAGWLGVSGDHVVLVREDGHLSVFKPSEQGIAEVGSGRILKGPCWSPCAITGGILLARDGRELKAIRLGRTKPNR